MAPVLGGTRPTYVIGTWGGSRDASGAIASRTRHPAIPPSRLRCHRIADPPERRSARARTVCRLRYRDVDVASSSHQRIRLPRCLSLFHNVLHLRSYLCVHRHPIGPVSDVAVPPYLSREEVCNPRVLRDAGSFASSSGRHGRCVESPGANQECQTKFRTAICREDGTAGSAFGWHRSSAEPGPRTVRLPAAAPVPIATLDRTPRQDADCASR